MCILINLTELSAAQQSPSGPGPSRYRDFTIVLRHTTIGSTDLDKLSARRETSTWQYTQNTQEGDIHTPTGFEPAIPASERPQTHASDRSATGIGKLRGTNFNSHFYL